MVATLTIYDETTLGQTTNELTLDFLTEHITVRELIRSRVYQEVKDYNARKGEFFRGLVQPTHAETTLNGFKMRVRREIDWQRQYDKAVEAFEVTRIIILIDNKQVESLDQDIVIRSDTQVTFLRLMPLVGG
jgi:hypothetical protein